MDWSPISSALSSGGNIVSTILQNKQNKKQAEKARQFSKDAATTAWQRDMATWERSNAYNAPQAQRERLEKAGINPNIAFGSGNAAQAGNTSTSTPKHQNYEQPVAELASPLGNPLQMIGQFMDIEGKKLSNDAQSVNNEFLTRILNNQVHIQNENIRHKTRENLTGEWLLGSPQSNEVKNSQYMRRYNEQTKAIEKSNAVKDISLDFYKTVPKQYQWAIQLLNTWMRR